MEFKKPTKIVCVLQNGPETSNLFLTGNISQDKGFLYVLN